MAIKNTSLLIAATAAALFSTATLATTPTIQAIAVDNTTMSSSNGCNGTNAANNGSSTNGSASTSSSTDSNTNGSTSSTTNSSTAPASGN